MAGIYRCAVVLALGLVVGVEATLVRADSKAERHQAAASLVNEALECELDGLNDKRKELLESALEQVSNYPPAMWQSGHVLLHNKWVEFAEIPNRSEHNRSLKAYQRMRAKTPNTVPGLMALAEWSAARKLPQRTRAHLNQVLELSPDHEQARALLGHQRIDGQWLDIPQQQAMRAEAVQLDAALRKWQPKLAKLLRDLDAKKLSTRESAREELSNIDAPDAVAAIELILAAQSEELAELAVTLLDKIDTLEAVAAITRIAIYSPWESVQRTAVNRLKPRDPAAYAPMLIALLESPLVSRAEFVRAANGQFVYRHLIYREGQEEVEATLHETNYPLSGLRQVPTEAASRKQSSLLRYDARREMMNLARLRDATSKARSVETSVAQRNLTSKQRNERVCAVLSGATGVDLPAEARDWWQWWNNYNEFYTSGEKQLKESRSYDTVRYRDPYRTGQYARQGDLESMRYAGMTFRGAVRRRGSCLQAGTLVYTESGHVQIEDIQVGDMVLSQDPETGQLDYKPVLTTTVRPPTRAYHIRVGDESICASGGHPFWVAGSGWLFTRDLEVSMYLHTVAGTAEIEDSEQFGVDEFYNLIVADFHTYFITKSNVLTHDNTIREASDYAVPGLVKK